MAELAKQDHSISEDTLHGAFPFIKSKKSGGHGTSLSESRQKPLSPLGIPRRTFPSELFQNLTKSEMQRVLEILHFAAEATTGDDVHYLLQLLQRAVACPRVIGGVAQLDTKGGFKEFNSVINVSYSNDWLYTYGTRQYATVDPVLQALLSSFKTQTWEQTYKKTSTPRQCEFIEEARSYGLTNGMTTGLLEHSRRFASFFSFAGGDPDDVHRYKGLVEYLIPYLHRVLIANIHTPLPNRVKGLSRRETSVLMWMKQGKTNWEISRILGVSERTVRFHVEGIFVKLDVSSRTQAVACAIEQGLLSDE
ncbi:MAG TPA: LuxR C-terminal-related transcriptional regulator [Nitrospira sp.]|nr:LuxR C-terminal-related transcriptional regulator [Nitrospira sp.]